MNHISVLLNETIDSLNIKENGIYVDCTLGYAGHSSAILKRLKKGKLFAFDQDEDARKASENTLSKISDNFEIIPTNFVNLKEELMKRGVTKVDGIMFDLGVSSPQLDNASRGFSFHSDAPLDMRMDKSSSLTAKKVVNEYSFNDLYKIIKEYGEEKYAKQIARNIEEKRKQKTIETTLELAEIIADSVPAKYKKLAHPSRRTFQAIRIEVNDEIRPLCDCIKDCIDVLNKNGRLVVITFHSLEDRAVKEAFSEAEGKCTCPKDLPYCVCNYKSFGKVINKKPILPSKEEQEENSRSRSAKLRIFEKSAEES